MSSNLFFPQALRSNPPPVIRAGKSDAIVLNSSSSDHSPSEATASGRDNFLITLQQVSQAQSANRRSTNNGAFPLSDSPASLPDSQSEDDVELAAVPVDPTSECQAVAEILEIPSTWNLNALVSLSAALGDPEVSGASGVHPLANLIPAEAGPLSALKMLIAGFQQNQPAPSADLSVGPRPLPTADLPVGPQQLVQIIAAALEGQAAMAADGDPGQVLDAGQVKALKQLQHWLNDLISGVQQAKASADLPVGPGLTDAKLTAPMSAASERFVLATENTQAPSQANSQSSLDPKPSNAAPGPSPDINLASQTKTAADSQAAAPSNAKVNPSPGFASETRAASSPNSGQAPDIEARPGERSQPTAPGSARNPAVLNLSDTLIQSNAGEEPLSRVVREAQLVKEGVVKLDSGSIEENVGKVVKAEAGSSDQSLLNSAGPNVEKLAEPAAKLKGGEAAQVEFRNQTLDQIVRKAAIHLGNGLHEARIELKPDFLGHIRMQVISDHHQVTVRILAEHGFVKDMIESNVHQLKADLQQQGLEIDKLEVSVSRDPEDSGNSRDKPAQSKFRQGQANPNADRDPGEEQPEKPRRRSILTEEGSAGVDYFA